MNLVNEFNSILWDEQFWLPNNYSWTQINEYTNFSFKYTIAYPITIAFFIYIVRVCFER
jgi:hypothetical protein